ncbi:MAG TPA: hypothetical protein VFQ61_38975 [Polyangiaceae bacterium]|nr:hypothetical protein [Polyangiaceae bacterium]
MDRRGLGEAEYALKTFNPSRYRSEPLDSARTSVEVVRRGQRFGSFRFDPRRPSYYLVSLASCVGMLAWPTAALAEDGGNEVCPANYASANDVRERYDARGRLVHQLRLEAGQQVEEIAIQYGGAHATERTELTPGRRRVAKTQWNGDSVTLAECYVDGVLTASATYGYQDTRVALVTRRFYEKPATERVETTRFFYDYDGQLIGTELRDGEQRLLSTVRAERAPLRVPVQLSFNAGGSYQTDTNLYDVTAGFGIHRRPQAHRYGADPLEVELDGNFRFHRAAGITSTDQTTARFSADYHEILPHVTLFTFTASDRNLPANLRLNLEQALLGVKYDFLPRTDYQLDISFAPIWNFRSIIAPPPAGEEGAPSVNETTSKLRGSLRARAGVHRTTWALRDTFEFLPTLYGDDVPQENGFWNRAMVRNTVTLELNFTPYLSLREEFKYTRDPAMRAQASCPDDSNPLCRGYSIVSTSSIVLRLDL